MFCFKMRSTVAFLLFFGSLYGCGSDDRVPPDVSKEQPLCPQDGFCVIHDDGKFFFGGYRRGDKEIQFQIAQRRNNLFGYLMEQPNYCGRLLTHTQHVFYAQDCRAEWPVGQLKPDYDPTAYYDLVVEFYNYVLSQPALPGHHEQWRWLIAKLRPRASSSPTVTWTDEQERNKRYALSPENASLVEGMQQNLLEQAKTLSKSGALMSSAPDAHSSLKLAGPNLLVADDNKQPETAQSQSMLFGIDVDSVLSVAESVADGTIDSAIGGSSGSTSDAATRIILATQVENPKLEFRQEVEIWAQRARLFLNGGPRIGSEHSATRIRLYQRALGSRDKWVRLGEIENYNHGAGPEEGDMRIKRTCGEDVLPITPGFYIWGGSCAGRYGFYHLCNDDTAYQLRSAFGVSTETNAEGQGACRGRMRYNPPLCRVPW